MICRKCRTSFFSRLIQHHKAAVWSAAQKQQQQHSLQRSNFRPYSVSSKAIDGKPAVSDIPPPPAPRQPVTGDITVSSAISSATPGVSQPFSTPNEVHVPKSADQSRTHAPSSCLAGTQLQGLNYFKNKSNPLALEDSEYPEWLWGLLEDTSKKSKTEKGGVDVASMNKKQRKRYEKKLAARAATLPPQTPVHHQAVDITPAPYNRSEEGRGDLVAEAAQSLEKRAEITKSARAARRKGIREANFLRGL